MRRLLQQGLDASWASGEAVAWIWNPSTHQLGRSAARELDHSQGSNLVSVKTSSREIRMVSRLCAVATGFKSWDGDFASIPTYHGGETPSHSLLIEGKLQLNRLRDLRGRLLVFAA